MKDFLKAAIPILIVFAFFGGLVSCTAVVWKDCRKDHGLLYCVHVVSK